MIRKGSKSFLNFTEVVHDSIKSYAEAGTVGKRHRNSSTVCGERFCIKVSKICCQILEKILKTNLLFKCYQFKKDKLKINLCLEIVTLILLYKKNLTRLTKILT